MNPTARPRRTPTKPAGWIYLIHTWDDPHKYLGQSRRPVPQRVNEERKTMPWGADILPGRDGYTILRRVESLGSPHLDAIALDLAEAEEIQRWTPSDNANRPDPAMFRQRLQAARDAPAPPWTPRRPAPPTAPRRPSRTPRQRPTRRRPVGRWRAVGLVLLAATWALTVGRVAVAWPDPAAPWVAAPVAALLGPALTVRLYRRSLGRSRRRRR